MSDSPQQPIVGDPVFSQNFVWLKPIRQPTKNEVCVGTAKNPREDFINKTKVNQILTSIMFILILVSASWAWFRLDNNSLRHIRIEMDANGAGYLASVNEPVALDAIKTEYYDESEMEYIENLTKYWAGPQNSSSYIRTLAAFCVPEHKLDIFRENATNLLFPPFTYLAPNVAVTDFPDSIGDSIQWPTWFDSDELLPDRNDLGYIINETKDCIFIESLKPRSSAGEGIGSTDPLVLDLWIQGNYYVFPFIIVRIVSTTENWEGDTPGDILKICLIEEQLDFFIKGDSLDKKWSTYSAFSTYTLSSSLTWNSSADLYLHDGNSMDIFFALYPHATTSATIAHESFFSDIPKWLQKT